MFSVSLEPDAASAIITFKVNMVTSKRCAIKQCMHIWLSMQTVQVNITSCSLQWPESYTVTAIQQGSNANETFQSAEQAVMGMENECTLEKLDLRQRYQVSIKLQNYFSSSVFEITNICK